MAQRLHNLSKWILVEEGRALRFEKGKRRTVILDVNCRTEVGFYIVHTADDVVDPDPEIAADVAAGRGRVGPDRSDDGTILFLGVAKGRDCFEFGVGGGFSLITEGGPAYVYSADGLQTETYVASPMVYTRIANRRARNSQVEIIEYRRRLNEEARFRALEIEAERRVAAVEARLARYLPNRRGISLSERAVEPAGRPAGGAGVGDQAGADDAAAGSTTPATGGGTRRKKATAAADES